MEKLTHNTKPENIHHEEVFKDEHEKIIMLQAYEKAQAILDEESIKPEQFEDTYSEKLLTECSTYVTKCETFFAEKDDSTDPGWIRAEILGKTLEGLIHHQINNGVFGDDVRAISTAPYDDCTGCRYFLSSIQKNIGLTSSSIEPLWTTKMIRYS